MDPVASAADKIEVTRVRLTGHADAFRVFMKSPLSYCHPTRRFDS
jgi:hypothetical protein